jgi:hypothetical protein
MSNFGTNTGSELQLRHFGCSLDSALAAEDVVSPVSKTLADRERALAHLQALSKGTDNVYESYRSLYSLWCSNNSAVPELKPMFRIPGIEPDGRLTVDDAFRETLHSLAAKILPQFRISKEHTT